MNNDLISRSALYSKICALPSNIGLYEADDVERLLKEAPAVDAVEVVRCKDCKHFYEPDINPNRRCKRGGSQVWDVEFRADDFCSYGERKDGDK